MNSRKPAFLTLEDVLTLHRLAMRDEGGDPSVRDMGLLEAGIAMPQQRFGGGYLHRDIPSMAAAYAYHICLNHPFLDGKKRAAVAAMIAFLTDNDRAFDAEVDKAEATILALAAGSLTKQAMTEWVRSNVHPKRPMELRTFFRQFDLAAARNVADAVVASGRQAEADATLDEAAEAIPCIRDLLTAEKALREAGQEANADRVAYAIIVLAAVYRAAEDMGYEW
jgi:death-on-curing protein